MNSQPANPAPNQHELARLLAALCEDALEDHDAERLAQLLEADPQARQQYVEALHLDTSLRYLGGLDGCEPSDLSCRGADCASIANSSALSPADGEIERSWPAWLSPYVVAPALAAAMAACFLVGMNLGDAPNRVVQREQELEPEVDAEQSELWQGGPFDYSARVVSFTPDCEWGNMVLAVMRGTYLRPGQTVVLTRGRAELRFAEGASAVLEGPASLRIETDGSVFLKDGKATVVAPDWSGGLVLRTPSTLVEVKDSEVGVLVDEHGVADIKVLDGAVLARLLDSQGVPRQERRLTSGLAARFNSAQNDVSDVQLVVDTFTRFVPETHIAYHCLEGLDGVQDDCHGALGMDFVVKDPIVVTKLGVFDSGADGLKRTLYVELWERDEMGTPYFFTDDRGVGKLAEMTFTPDDQGDLVESSRFKPLEPELALKPGAYTIVAYGFGAGEPNGNDGGITFSRSATGQFIAGQVWESPAFKRLDDGNGAILFVGSARYDVEVGRLPQIVDPGNVNRYRAGTFEFRRLEQRGPGVHKLRNQRRGAADRDGVT